MDENPTQIPTSTQATPSTPTPSVTEQVQQPMSQDTKMLIVVLCLIFIYPIGLILMFSWAKSWPRWLKILITLPLIITVLLFIPLVVLSIISYFTGR